MDYNEINFFKEMPALNPIILCEMTNHQLIKINQNIFFHITFFYISHRCHNNILKNK